MFISTLIQCTLWCSTTLLFFGLNFASDKLPGNLYRNFVFLSLIEIPTILFAITFCDKFGRKWTSLVPILLAGVACLLVAPITKNQNATVCTIKVVVGIVGKFFVCIPFQTLYVWSSELFPVRCRAQGMGLMDCVSRVSAACAPLLTSNGGVSSWVVFMVLGVPSLLAAFLGMWLPETKMVDGTTGVVEEGVATEQTPLLCQYDAETGKS